MRVKISYSMELDEVPATVSKIIDKCTEHLATAQGLTLSTAEKTKKNPDVLQCLENISNTRELLMTADVLLGDAAEIMAGYGNTKINAEIDQNILEELQVDTPNNSGEE
mgnify:CR=1 FL=1